MNKTKKNNVVSFPLTASEVEREVEAILFAAVEPLDIESIETRISKKTNVLKSRHSSILKNISFPEIIVLTMSILGITFCQLIWIFFK